ncbi:ABC1 FAMILY PROTEIN [Salix viminalis]|uniref:ABC1 FAMILY PROTEIN n=1 Tax=Salix viminalis TaxID=40686 RepID=A0A9Q0TAF2_SALVM|nr:ABC1 FAMILY PROTEIN [Salix viminalis]
MLSSLQDQAVPCSFKDIKQVLQSNLDRDLKNIFLSFDEQPVAAASIAQVHRAMLKDHQEVAVKVQYPGLERQMKIDITIMSFLSKSVAWLFPDYRFNWLVTEFREVISSELDFIQEARNSEKTDRNFKNNKFVRIPHIFWELTTRQVLTMQFCWGHKVDDVEFMKETKINPIKVAKALMEVFAEMIFIHGFVHGDPHPGNILVSPEGPNGFTLVILDHGIYKQLDEGFRQDYCQLWKAMILQDTHKIQQLGEQLGAGKYAKFLPVIFLGRSVNSKAILGKGMSDEEKISLKQELNYLKVDDIFSFMESLPPDFLTILRTDGLLRSVIRKLGAPQHVRLLAYVKYAIRGLSPKLSPGSDSAIKVNLSRLRTNVSYLQLRLFLVGLQLLFWMKKVKQFLCTLIRTLLL